MSDQVGIMDLDDTMNKGQINRMSREFSPVPSPKKTSPKPRKQKPSEYWGFNIGRVHKTRSICESPMALFRFFTAAVLEKNPDARQPIPERLGGNLSAAQEVLQLLDENKCRDEETLSAWVIWYVNGLPQRHPCRKFVHILGLRETWARFRRFRPRPDNISATAVVKEQSVGWIADKMDDIFRDGFSKEKVIRSCKLFGVVLTAQYMLRVLGSKQVAEALLTSSLKEACLDKDAARFVYGASSLYGIGRAAWDSTFMSDWKARYDELWKSAACVQRQPDFTRDTIVAEFFRRMEKNESKAE